MNHLMKIVIVIFSMLFYLPAQAGFDLPMKQCVIFADEATDDSKKEGGETKEGDEETEEEEPDCD